MEKTNHDKEKKELGRINGLEKLSESEPQIPKSKWKGYFEDVVYSSGPDDNIYIYG